MYAIQFIDDNAKNELEAKEILEGLKIQSDYIGGRILEPCNQEGKDSWRIQVFFKDSEVNYLPDKCKRVFIMDSQKKQLGIIN